MSGYKKRILVVGTTRDYIEQILHDYPERTVFLTDPAEYPGAGPLARSADSELVYPLVDPQAVLDKLTSFLTEKQIRISGVACFDCESLLLAGEIAERLSLPFPSMRAIEQCRDKFTSKILWRASGVNCPRVSLARGERDVLGFIREVNLPVIMKPLTLSGSELVFKCSTQQDAVDGFRLINRELKRRLSAVVNRDRMIDANTVLCEEFIEGDEYSCDYVYDGGELKIIRTARKYLREGEPAGTVLAYEIPAWAGIALAPALAKAIQALELGRSMGMVDFVIRDSDCLFLELTPRPGGDCLPRLIRQSSGFDIIAAQLDFAEGIIPSIPKPESWQHLAGLRVHADKPGLLGNIVTGKRFQQDVLEECWYRKRGDHIGLPPSDYQSWLLGHVIFRPRLDTDTASQAVSLINDIELEIKTEKSANSLTLD